MRGRWKAFAVLAIGMSIAAPIVAQGLPAIVEQQLGQAVDGTDKAKPNPLAQTEPVYSGDFGRIDVSSMSGNAKDSTAGYPMGARPSGLKEFQASPAIPEQDTARILGYHRGDQTIGMYAGALIPTFLVPVTAGGVSTLSLGGFFGASYQYFLNSYFALGGNLCFAFTGTIGGSSMFILPFGPTAFFWWNVGLVEIGAGVELGFYMLRYNDYGFLGGYAKAGVGAYWIITSAFSAGLKANLWFIPEFHVNSNYRYLNQYAGMTEVSAALIYHL